MKLYTALILAALGVVGHGYPAQFNGNSDLVPIPQKNRTIRWMSLQQINLEMEADDEPDDLKDNIKSDKVRFFLFTRKNPTNGFELKTDDVESLKKSPFDARYPTRFMIHGFNGYYLGEENTVIREALFKNEERRKYNFISVDWSVYSETINYILAKNKCSKTGKIVAEFIDWMHENANLKFETLALYGHSLGAHVAGFAGKNVQYGKIDTIIGLDPAMPLFNANDPDTRLSSNDAKYVETIHTNGGLLGFYSPIGRASFYPNGGRIQPGCGDDIAGVCSHIRSAYYLAEALKFPRKNGLLGIGCSDLESLKNGECNQYGYKSNLGDPNNAASSFGIFYLETNSEPPFGMYARY